MGVSLNICAFVGLQVSVQVCFAGVALRAVKTGVWTNTVVRQHVLLQIKLPAQTFSTLGTTERFLSCNDRNNLTQKWQPFT